jgi:hypothetical protein
VKRVAEHPAGCCHSEITAIWNDRRLSDPMRGTLWHTNCAATAPD